MHSSFPLRVSTAMFELWRKGRRWACRKTSRVKVFAKLKLRFFNFCLKWLRKETVTSSSEHNDEIRTTGTHQYQNLSNIIVFLSLFWKQHFTRFVDFTAVQLLVVKKVGSVPFLDLFPRSWQESLQHIYSLESVLETDLAMFGNHILSFPHLLSQKHNERAIPIFIPNHNPPYN